MSIKSAAFAAERVLQVGQSEVRLRFGVPQQDGEDWCCTFELGELGEKGRAYGVDSLQAFLSALSLARSEVMKLQGVKWIGGNGSGIPHQIPVHLGPEFEQEAIDRVEAAILQRYQKR